MALTRVSPALFQVSNNITSVTVGGSANTISLTFDSNGVITGASNNAVSVANTAITGNIISSQITSVANTQLTGTITGSQISSNTLSNTVFQTGSVENYMSAVGLDVPMRNRIINGDMRIDQRATSLIDYGYATDRWSYNPAAASKATVAQSSTAPAGFNKSLLVTSSAATTPGSTDVYIIEQKIEGYNIADLGFGTANASTITISFWVRSSLTGTFGGALGNAGPDRSYPFTYTINAANTFEYKTVTIAGDTSGTWATTNGAAFRVCFSLGCGSSRSGTAGAWTGTSNIFSATGATSVVGTNGATFYITGVQLEAGTTASPFEYRQYGTELALCQRYYCKSYQIGTVPQTSTTAGVFAIVAVTSPSSGQAGVGGGNKWPVQMRTSPTVTIYSQIGTAGKLSSGGADNGTSVTSEAPSEIGAVGIVSTGGLTNNNWYYGHFVATAEL